MFEYLQSEIIYIVKDYIFNSTMVDYIKSYDNTVSDGSHGSHGIMVVLHGIDDVIIKDACMNDVKIFSIRTGGKITFPLFEIK
jgi:hypothetical protein